MNLLDWIGNEVPIWILAILVFALAMAAAWWGERMHLNRKKPDGADDSTAEGYIISGVVGLLALLLGFTFSIAVDRYESRRLLVLEEANAIRTVYLQAGTFPDPYRGRLRTLLTRYIDHKLELAPAYRPADVARLRGLTQAYQERMWAETLAAVETRRDDVASAFMSSMSALIDLGAARRTAREAHVPRRVFVLLFVYMMMTAVALGYVMGPRRRLAVSWLLALTTLAYVLIFDVDGATRGGVRESQEPMETLKAAIVRLQGG